MLGMRRSAIILVIGSISRMAWANDSPGSPAVISEAREVLQRLEVAAHAASGASSPGLTTGQIGAFVHTPFAGGELDVGVGQRKSKLGRRAIGLTLGTNLSLFPGASIGAGLRASRVDTGYEDDTGKVFPTTAAVITNSYALGIGMHGMSAKKDYRDPAPAKLVDGIGVVVGLDFHRSLNNGYSRADEANALRLQAFLPLVRWTAPGARAAARAHSELSRAIDKLARVQGKPQGRLFGVKPAQARAGLEKAITKANKIIESMCAQNATVKLFLEAGRR